MPAGFLAGTLRRAAAAALRAAGYALAFLWVVSEDLARLAIEPVLAVLARVAFWHRVEAAIAALPPWGALLVLAVPYAAVVQPAEIVGLVWLAEGRFAAGLALLAGSKILGMALVLRLHAVAFDKLMTIGWYGRLYRWAMALRARLYALVLDVPGVRVALDAIRAASSRLRAAAAAAFACLRARLQGVSTASERNRP